MNHEQVKYYDEILNPSTRVLVAIAALIAVCRAAKLDRTYLPPQSAATAGGSSDSLQAPLTRTSEQGDSSENLPTGSYTNSFQGVVVDAAAAGIRASSDADQSGLGGPRDSYGTQHSKVGDAAFRGSIAGFRNTPFGGSGFNGKVPGINVEQNFGPFESKSERPQASKDRSSNIISYANDVSLDNYSYGFETDNGISVGENGVANNGIQAQGGYSYKGDDGQVYKVTYVADEGGYRPQGDHLPTPPPIPKEILESLEKNAKDEAAGLIDDGSYDAQKYNAEGDYTHSNGDNIQYNGAQSSLFSKRPESDATASNTFINQNNQAFGKPGQSSSTGTQSVQSNFNGQSNQFGSNFSNNHNGLTRPQQQVSSQGEQQESSSTGNQGFVHNYQTSSTQLTQSGQPQGILGSQSSQFGTQSDHQAPISQFETQSSQFSSQSSQPVSGFKPAGQSSQFGPQVTQNSESNTQLNDQDNLGSSPFGAQPNRPSFVTNPAFNAHQNQFGYQATKPQSSFGTAEHLLPFNSNNRPSYNKPQQNFGLSSHTPSKNNQSPGFLSAGGQNQDSTKGPSGSSFASVGLAGIQPQTFENSNNYQNQPSKPSPFNFNNGQSVSNVVPTHSQHSETHTAPGLVTAVKPTSIPSIELTTPLEPNENPSFIQNSQYNAQSNPSPGNFGSQSLNNQEHAQIGVQNSVAAPQQPTSQTLSPSFEDSRPQGTFQYGSTSPTPAAFSTTLRPGINGEQLQYSQTQQDSYYSTQKPSISQGPDESYYYNKPAKTFGTPVNGRPQGSRFPSMPSYQPNAIIANQFFSQQGSQPSFSKVPNSVSDIPAAPTPSSQFTQTQGSFPTNGITQASISAFPSVSPTTSSQYTTQADYFGSKPNVPSFPSKPGTAVPQKPSTFFSQNQIQFGQSSSFNNNLPSASQPFSSNPTTTFGQTLSSSTTQSPIQFGQSSINSDKPQTPENSQSQGATYTQNQQYDGTVYEYNKPPEVLPAPAQTDSSSSQSVQTDLSSKPQEGQKSNSQTSQIGQLQFSSQPSSLNQGSKPQFESTFKPFSGSQSGQNQLGQNTQTTFSQQNTQQLHGTEQAAKPNKSPSVTTHFGQNQQTGFGSKPNFVHQPAKPFETATSSQFEQNIQQQNTNAANSFKPFGAQTANQYGQKTQTDFGNNTQLNSRPQTLVQANKPFGSASVPSQIGQASQKQNLQNTGPQPFGTIGSFQASGSQNFQGNYLSSKPQHGNQLTLPQFVQTSQQTLSTMQISSQPQANAVAAKPFGNGTTVHRTPDSVFIGPNTQVNQGSTQSFGSSFGQQLFQPSQFGSSASKPQYGAQAQFGQNQNVPNKPLGSVSSQTQFGAQASSSAESQPSGVQTFRPFGTLPSSNFQTHNLPQLDQAPQSSAVSTTSAPQQAGVQAFGTESQTFHNQPQVPPFNSVKCCTSTNMGSAIAPLNVGKPSQAFAQTQSQFTGFQGAQSFNAQNLAGRGEEFGGSRPPPSFDAQTGYHY